METLKEFLQELLFEDEPLELNVPVNKATAPALEAFWQTVSERAVRS